jgi:glucose dehydrogenase
LEYLETGKNQQSVSPSVQAAVTAEQPAKREVESELGPGGGTSVYRFTGYKKFLDPDGYPAVAPPWGTLNAIDLNTGRYLWKVPLGNYPELAAKGMPDTGTENYGGPMVTAGGVLLIGATIYDHKFRAFDTKTGRLLWSAELPYAGNATPATYMMNGKQYVVIATSGQRNVKGPQGAAYVAFALP